MSPFYVPPSYSLPMYTNEIFGNHIHPASLTNQINDLITSGAIPPSFISQSPTLLFDKARGQLMTTLNMHPVNGQLTDANIITQIPLGDQGRTMASSTQAFEVLESATQRQSAQQQSLNSSQNLKGGSQPTASIQSGSIHARNLVNSSAFLTLAGSAITGTNISSAPGGRDSQAPIFRVYFQKKSHCKVHSKI